MSDVSVLILNFNGIKFMGPCLESVAAQKCPIHEVVVVDNGSTDGSPEQIEEDFPSVRLLRARSNLGFAGGMNLAIAKSTGDLVLLLNNDVVLEPGFLDAMVEAINSDPAVGSVSGKVYKLAEKDARILDTTGHVVFRNRLFTDRGDGEADTGQFDAVEEIFGACAGAALYRRRMLEDLKVGGEVFDESFFLFLEDTDLNWRARLRGWKCLYTPQAVAWHYRGGTAVRRSKLVELHNYKNRYMMLIKNDSLASVARQAPQLLLTDTLKTAALLWRCPPALLGWIDVWRNLPALLKKRRIIQAGRTVSQAELERWFQPFGYRRWMEKHLKKS